MREVAGDATNGTGLVDTCGLARSFSWLMGRALRQLAPEKKGTRALDDRGDDARRTVRRRRQVRVLTGAAGSVDEHAPGQADQRGFCAFVMR
ncbi:hypothetical protein GUJ93_ZPchr0012g21329 [Zizania palustris]|uniref:Uncharacterized protein n=1 Tax=Zizania palustris TaxID=103762 RepID=A0A8J6BTE8_ZIZPA|nr:hypothetical protein GUJ93_ZPchr0012g21329 [Zizania palustris]